VVSCSWLWKCHICPTRGSLSWGSWLGKDWRQRKKFLPTRDLYFGDIVDGVLNQKTVSGFLSRPTFRRATLRSVRRRFDADLGSISRNRFGRNLHIVTNLVKFKFVIKTVNGFKIPQGQDYCQQALDKFIHQVCCFGVGNLSRFWGGGGNLSKKFFGRNGVS
jgi:hypothetical protein